MNIKWILLLSSAVVLSGCLVAPRPGGGIQIIPFLPAIVELDDDSYYAQGGYHYFYADERWYYSPSRNGQRSELPRSHWPRETRYRGGHPSRR